MFIPPLWLANAFGWVVSHKRLLLTLLAILIVLGACIGIYRGCKSRTVKLNEAEIQKAQEAIKTRNDEELRKILVDVEVREKTIDANVAEANAATVNAQFEAKKKYSEMNTSQLAEELEKLK